MPEARRGKSKGEIRINRDRCKGCGFCIEFCPKKLIIRGTDFNAGGYFAALFLGGDCTGCTLCAVICPDVAIEVWREGSRDDDAG